MCPAIAIAIAITTRLVRLTVAVVRAWPRAAIVRVRRSSAVRLVRGPLVTASVTPCVVLTTPPIGVISSATSVILGAWR